MTSTPAVLVRCEDVSRSYGKGRAAVVALHGVTCEVRAGDAIAVSGPSGSGKSTLLHLMAGLDRPTTGSVTWPALGARPALWPSAVGIVFQGPSLVPALDVLENVTLPLLLAGDDPPEARAVAAGALEALGLGELSGKLPEELSGGQAQRVAVARVLAARPRLVLADEPTGQLDHATGATVIDALLHAARASGAGLVVSTHDPAVAGRLATHWNLVDGRLGSTAAPMQGVGPCSA